MRSMRPSVRPVNFPRRAISTGGGLRSLSSELKVETLDAIYDQAELAEPFSVRLKLEFATTETEVHQADIAAGELPIAQDLVSPRK